MSFSDDELIVDLFAGGGGASEGLRMALGRSPDMAVDLHAPALAMHASNHPTCDHRCVSVWNIDPRAVLLGRRIGLLWASPPCQSFSTARGGAAVDRGQRSLAWSVVRWAKYRRPRVILVENVPGFAEWSPVGDDGKTIRARNGETFQAWVKKLRAYGYVVEWRLLVAADYGTPTTRKRLYVGARCDGAPITWPAPTHGAGRAHTWQSAASVLDFTLPCPSIFTRQRPLKPATLRRIAVGIRRYVLEPATPHVVHGTYVPTLLTNTSVHCVTSVAAPLATVTTGDHHYVVAAQVQRVGAQNGDAQCAYDPRDPMRMITSRASYGLVTSSVVPTLITHGYSEKTGTATRKAQAPRCLDINRPLGTVCKSAIKHAVVVSHLQNVRTHGSGGGQGPQSIDAPLPTVTCAKRGGMTLCEATVASGERGRSNAVRELLATHAGVTGAMPREIIDIGLRMLNARELASAQGFPRDYILSATYHDKTLTKTAQVACVGNACCPPVVAAIVRANFANEAP